MALWSAYDPMREMRRIHSEMSRLFDDTARAPAGFPAINVYADQHGAAITAEIPGVSQETLDVSVHRDTVTIRGERSDAPEGARGAHRRERRQGRFARTLTLPFPVDPDAVEAHLENGTLRLSLKRPEADKPRRIQIASA